MCCKLHSWINLGVVPIFLTIWNISQQKLGVRLIALSSILGVLWHAIALARLKNSSPDVYDFTHRLVPALLLDTFCPCPCCRRVTKQNSKHGSLQFSWALKAIVTKSALSCGHYEPQFKRLISTKWYKLGLNQQLMYLKNTWNPIQIAKLVQCTANYREFKKIQL